MTLTLIDMNLSPRWVGVLNSAGIEAAHWSTPGVSNAPDSDSDSEIMAYAAEHGYVVLTHDLDFGSILAATHGEKPGCAVVLRVVLPPLFDEDAGFFEAVEDFAVEQFVSELVVERLAVTVLPPVGLALFVRPC
jgi:predicted nuclease of predicted toxin-antitoxin system